MISKIQNKVKPLKVYKQPYKWRQAITSKYQEKDFFSFLRYPFLKFGSDYANHNSYLFDYLIIL